MKHSDKDEWRSRYEPAPAARWIVFLFVLAALGVVLPWLFPGR